MSYAIYYLDLLEDGVGGESVHDELDLPGDHVLPEHRLPAALKQLPRGLQHSVEDLNLVDQNYLETVMLFFLLVQGY